MVFILANTGAPGGSVKPARQFWRPAEIFGFCPRITRTNANVGQARCLPVEEHPVSVVSKICENDGKKEFGFSFDTAAQFWFHAHNPKRLGWQFLQRVFYASFLRRIASITPRDSTQNPASLLAAAVWRCGVRDWSATPVLSLYRITTRSLAYERGQPPCRCAMAGRFRRLSTRVDCGGHHQYLANRRPDHWTRRSAYGQPGGGDDSEQQLPREFCRDAGESSICSSGGRAAAPAPLLVLARHGFSGRLWPTVD